MKPLNIQKKYLLLTCIALFCVFAAILWMLLFNPSGQKSFPVGMVRKTEIRIASEIGGYVQEIRFKQGEAVRAGEIVAVLSSPEIEAAVLQARKALAQAEASRARVYVGVRYEEVEQARQEVEKNKSSVTLARAEFERAKDLARKNDVSQQVLDDRSAQLADAEAALTSSQAALAEAEKGATAEDKAKADRTVDLAKATLAAALERQAKLTLYAPVDSTIWNVIAEPGEAVTLGQPVLALEKHSDVWFSFNIREDNLGRMTIGSVLSLKTGDGNTVRAKVKELRNLGEFAVWHAERAISSYDLATFELRAEGMGPIPESLQPGMTAWILEAE